MQEGFFVFNNKLVFTLPIRARGEFSFLFAFKTQ